MFGRTGAVKTCSLLVPLKMKAILLMLLMFQAVRLTSQSELESVNEESDANYNNDNRFLEGKVSRRSANDDTITIQLRHRSNISWEFLAISFNLTTEDLELSYETIWNEGKRTVTLKRARGPAEDKKDLHADEYHTSKQTRNKKATKQHGDTNQRVRAKRVIVGEDERKNLPSSSKAQKSPHSAACKVSCKGFCSWSCSGILIGQRHVLTSAHCIDDVNVATLQAGFLERNGRLQWYGVSKAYVPLRWKISKDDDYAVLKLRGLPNRRSFVHISSMSLPTGSMISITGFPSDKAPSSLWMSKCRALKVTSGLIWNDCDAARGSSGSGVLLKDTSSGSTRTVVVGVLSREGTLRRGSKKLRLNVAVHLTGTRLSQVNEWTSE